MVQLIKGCCLEKLKELAENSVDSIVTDPPYGLKFMGKKWDYEVPSIDVWKEALRVLKPGGHLLSFGGTRTYHRMVVNIEDAGFEIRDCIQWLYGSGFPKSHNIKDGVFKGYGTALKPANEPICVARKPLEKGLTVAENVIKWGCGAMNIDASRIGTEERTQLSGKGSNANCFGDYGKGEMVTVSGRWPANIILDEVAAEMLDEQSGPCKTGGRNIKTKCGVGFFKVDVNQTLATDNGSGASRFFYVAKASKSERNAGLDSYEQVDISNECKEENTAAVQLLQKVISESMVRWNIGECGKKLTALYQKECKSIISTEINKIIESKTLNVLIHLLTNENIQDALTDLSLVENAESLKKFLLTITNEKMELALGAVNVALKMLYSVSVNENSKDFSNFHSTVKPIKLMQYLINLVTPTQGTVLDPFMGSGSTGVAAKNLNRKFIGIELNEEYFEIAKNRINRLQL